MKKIFLSALVSLLLICPISYLSAHAEPVSYEPEVSSSQLVAPSVLRIGFSESLEPTASGAVVTSAELVHMEKKSAQVSTVDPRTLEVELIPLSDGVYTVAWHVVSKDDGHFSKGAYQFVVGISSSTTPVDFVDSHSQNSSTKTEAFLVAIELLGQALLIGFVGMLFAIGGMERSGDSAPVQSAKRFVLVAVVAIALGACGYIVFKSYGLALLTQESFSAALVLFMYTVAGSGALLRGCAAILFMLLFWSNADRILGERGVTTDRIIMVVLLSAMTLSRAQVSHAAASHIYPLFSVLVNWVHLSAKDLWIGGIIALTFFFIPNTKGKQERYKYAVRFGYLAIFALLVGGVTGSYIIWLHLKSFENLGTAWGYEFIFLSFFAAALFSIRLYNQIVVLPQWNAAERQMRLLLAEALMGVFVIFHTGVLIITTPPLPAKVRLNQQVVSNGAHLQLSQKHPGDAEIQLTVHNRYDSVSTPEVQMIKQDGSGIPLTVLLRASGSGSYSFPRNLMDTEGIWRVLIDAPQKDAYDAIADFAISVPKDIDGKSDAPVAPDFFMANLIYTAIVIVGVAYFLSGRLKLLPKQLS